MRSFFTDFLPYLLSILTVWTLVLAGDKKRGAWLAGLLNQFFWFVYVISTHTWGLLPLTICMTVVYANNLKKWGHEEENLHSKMEKQQEG